MSVREGELLWTASPRRVGKANITAFRSWLAQKHGLHFSDYEALRAWSVAELDQFWARVWEYFAIISDTPYVKVRSGGSMPGVSWFEGARVNYAEHVLRHEHEDPDKVALFHTAETGPLGTTSWRELGKAVRKMANTLRELGITPGDRIAACMPNSPETMIAMLAATAIGAVWTSAAPEFGAQTIIDRFAQIEPKLVFAVTGYRFGGKIFDRRDQMIEVMKAVPSVRQVVWLESLGLAYPILEGIESFTWENLQAGTDVPPQAFRFERVPHDHPLWVLFSSGTTGLPKAITHSHVGIVVEHLKMAAFHLDLHAGSVMFFYTTTGWMMWNSLMLSLLMGGSAVLYDGSPAHPDLNVLWRLAAETRATLFGASPSYIELMRKHRIVPGDRFDLGAMDTVLLSGSPATPETFLWFYENVKRDIWITSQSGGTEFCSGIVVAVPGIPVRAGEIPARALGVDVRVLSDDGRELIGEVGEMVIMQPMPSMPIYLWGDGNHARYRESYFDTYPGAWRHGDFMKLNARGGAYVYGRSDSTLNRYGVRIGSSEIYRTMEGIDDVLDSLVVCTERPDGGFYMPLFVVLRNGAALEDGLDETIRHRLRTERSPRHVPDEILAVPSIPYTLSGKKMEVPVRKLLMGWPPARAFSRDAMKDGTAMDWFADFAARRLSGSGAGFFSAHMEKPGADAPGAAC